MPRRKPTGFDSYTFTEDEMKAATRLMPLQKALYQTLAADAAIEKAMLKFDPLNPLIFAQREAELQGQIGILLHLVALSEEKEVAEVRRPNQQTSVTAIQPSQE